MRAAVLIALLTLLAAVWWRCGGIDVASPGEAGRADGVAAATGHAAGRAPSLPADRGAAAERQRVAGAADDFVSESDESGVVAQPVRDGLVLLVVDAERRPQVHAPIDVRWRTGGGGGNDHGRTDASGRFATTIAEHERIAGVTLQHPELGELANWSDYLPLLEDPRTVLVVVPGLVPVVVRVVDPAGTPVAGAQVTCDCDRGDRVPREHVLMPDTVAGTTAADGRTTVRVPAGQHDFTVAAEAHVPLYRLRAGVPAAGRALTLHLLPRRGWREVTLTVIGASGPEAALVVGGCVPDLPAGLPGIEPRGVDYLQVQLEATRRDANVFTLVAPPLPLECWARSGASSGFVEVGAFQATAVVALPAPVVQPMAHLRYKLLWPHGEPAEESGYVVVHRTPSLADGSKEDLRRDEPVIRVPAGGTACVSARVVGHPPCLVGPIELREGEQDLVFQLVAPRTIRGRVVDERGTAVRASVSLLRPAGALRALAAGVPAILPVAAAGDTVTTLDDGRFAFDSVGDGEHELWVQPGTAGWPACVRVRPGDVDVTVRLGDGIADRVRIQGRVTVAGTGRPIAGAQVRWGPHWGNAVFTDADGRYVDLAPPGALSVHVFARRFAVAEHEPRAFAAGLHTVDVVMQPSEPFFLRVRAPDDVLAKLEVAAEDANGRVLTLLDSNGCEGTDAELDTDGRARLDGLPTTAFRLRLRMSTTGGGSRDANAPTMLVDVPANVRRDADFVVVWQPAK